jgi:DNA-binding Xre family transcriptional regulator
MLKYNFKRIFNERGITKPVGYLHKHGFNNQTAARISSHRFKDIRAAQLEKVCLALHCTPNDIFEWIPDEKHKNLNHPLTKLIRTTVPEQVANLFKEIPIDKLPEFTEQIKNLRTKLLNPE